MKIHEITGNRKIYTHIIAKDRQPVSRGSKFLPSIKEETYDITSTVRGEEEGNLGASTRFILSVGLPLPDSISFEYPQNWNVDEMGIFEGSFRAIADKMLEHGVDITSSTLQANASSLSGGALNAGLGFLNNTSATLTRAIQKNYRLAYNPNKELLFQSPGFRSFTFNWKLQPISKEDAKRIDKMIKDIIYYSQPDTLDSSFSPFILPAEFTVKFMGVNIPPLQTLVITNVSTNYTAGGMPRFFHDGNPAFIELSISFMELERLTRRNVFGESNGEEE